MPGTSPGADGVGPVGGAVGDWPGDGEFVGVGVPGDLVGVGVRVGVAAGEPVRVPGGGMYGVREGVVRG